MKMRLLAQSKCPGKLILSGEHSAVYGKRCVATTVDLYTKVELYEIDHGNEIKLKLDNLCFEKCWPYDSLKRSPRLVDSIKGFEVNDDILKRINDLIIDLKDHSANISNSCIAFLLLYLSIGDLSERKCIQVNVSSNLPNGAGLGSSSSYIVALAKALFTAFDVPIENKVFNRWCYEGDKLFHGKPSGVDNSICTFGGAILFGSGEIIEQINHDQMPNLQVILVNTEVSRNTKNMVERSRNRLNMFSEIGNQLLDLLGTVSQQVWDILITKENLNELSVLFEMNQHLLNCLDVGHERIDTIVSIAKRNGYAAKLTGAGGGGIVMIYLTNETRKDCLLKELHSNGFPTNQVKLGVPAVQSIQSHQQNGSN